LEQRIGSKARSDEQETIFVCSNKSCKKKYVIASLGRLKLNEKQEFLCEECGIVVHGMEKEDPDSVFSSGLGPIIIENESFRAIKDLLVQTNDMEFPHHRTYARVQQQNKNTILNTGGKNTGKKGSYYSNDDQVKVQVVLDGIYDHNHIPGVTKSINLEEQEKKVIKNETPPWIMTKLQRAQMKQKEQKKQEQEQKSLDIETIRKENRVSLQNYLHNFFHELAVQQQRLISTEEQTNGSDENDKMEIDEDQSSLYVSVGNEKVNIFDVSEEIQERMTPQEYREYFQLLNQVLPHPL